MATALDVLLIGGSGFMGPAVARALLEAGHRVTILSRGRRAPLDGVTMITADRGDPAALAAALENRRFDFTVDFLVFDAVDLERLLLVPYAALGRYVMISTGQVYLVTRDAEPPFLEESADGALHDAPGEESPLHAGWVYGIGKRRAEQALLALRATHGMRAVALRLPIVTGEGDESLRLWGYLERMLDGGPIVLPDGGRRLTRHLDVRDLARAVARLAESGPPRGAFYNLAQPEALPLADLLARIARAAGVTPRFVEASWDECRAAGLDASCSPYAGPWASVLDPSRAAAEWGFLGTRPDDYLPRIVRWHLDHRPPQSHEGYAQRSTEVALAARLAGAAR
ncbi:MAG: NAD-dependent epimerase/dehydratase family protein [Candidatus Eisenbacteria bacterium]|nr:NAD-dependent epimerase/dehydratase family protein [Candidatus Eisenbacteria bacterium]